MLLRSQSDKKVSVLKITFFFKDRIDFRDKIPIFKLVTLEDEKVNGWFYKANLKPVQKRYLSPKKIIKERQKAGRGKEVLIEQANGSTKWINVEQLFIPTKPKSKKAKKNDS